MYFSINYKHLFPLVIIFSITFTTLFNVAEANPVPDRYSPSEYIAIAIDDYTTGSKPRTLIHERWTNELNRSWLPIEGSRMAAVTRVPNPAVKFLPLPPKPYTLENLLSALLEATPLVRVPSFDPEIIHLAEPELLDDPRWPLNWKLRPEDLRPMTCDEVKGIFFEHYQQRQNTLKDRTRCFSNIPACDGQRIIWQPEAGRDYTVRDLLDALALHRTEPRMSFEIFILPTLDTREGYGSLQKVENLQWNMGKNTSANERRMVLP